MNRTRPARMPLPPHWGPLAAQRGHPAEGPDREAWAVAAILEDLLAFSKREQ